jgi:hypothetical protein
MLVCTHFPSEEDIIVFVSIMTGAVATRDTEAPRNIDVYINFAECTGAEMRLADCPSFDADPANIGCSNDVGDAAVICKTCKHSKGSGE